MGDASKRQRAQTRTNTHTHLNARVGLLVADRVSDAVHVAISSSEKGTRGAPPSCIDRRLLRAGDTLKIWLAQARGDGAGDGAGDAARDAAGEGEDDASPEQLVEESEPDWRGGG